MLKTTADALWQEWSTATEVLEQRQHVLRDLTARYHGPCYEMRKAGDYAQDYDILNYGLAMVKNLQPACVAENPRPIVQSKRPEVQEAEAKALELALRRWIEEVSLRDTLDKLLVDFAMTYGVAHLTREPAPGEQEHSDPIYWPQLNRLPQEYFAWDQEAKSWETTRWRGHRWYIDKDDLKQRAKDNPDEGWNLETIERLTPNAKSHWQYDDADDDRRKSGLREQVEIIEIWVPEVTADEARREADEAGKSPAQLGYHGSLYYIAFGVLDGGTGAQPPAQAHQVRAPQPYYGPRTGPYYLYGAYDVPNESAPLGPLTASDGQTRAANEIFRSAHDMARRYKRVYGFDESNTASIEAVQNKDHEDFVPLPNSETGKMADTVVPLEIGGLTQQVLTQAEYEKQIADEATGQSEALRGNVTGGTATENAIAAGASSAQIEWLADKFQRCTVPALRGVAWFLHADDDVVIPLGTMEAEDRELRKAAYQGGRPSPEKVKAHQERFPDLDLTPPPAEGPEDQTGSTFDDLELTIEAGSMGRKSEAKRRIEAAEITNFIVGVAPVLPQIAPFINVKMLLEGLEDRTGIPYSSIIEADGLEQMAALQLAQIGMQMEQGQGQPSQPRMSRTTGGQSQYPPGGPVARTPSPMPSASTGQGQPGLSSGQQSRNGAL